MAYPFRLLEKKINVLFPYMHAASLYINTKTSSCLGKPARKLEETVHEKNRKKTNIGEQSRCKLLSNYAAMS